MSPLIYTTRYGQIKKMSSTNFEEQKFEEQKDLPEL